MVFSKSLRRRKTLKRKTLKRRGGGLGKSKNNTHLPAAAARKSVRPKASSLKASRAPAHYRPSPTKVAALNAFLEEKLKSKSDPHAETQDY